MVEIDVPYKIIKSVGQILSHQYNLKEDMILSINEIIFSIVEDDNKKII